MKPRRVHADDTRDRHNDRLPLADRVILWTRITESTPSASEIPVHWELAATPDFVAVLKSGTQRTNAARDWTVKVDVSGLAPATMVDEVRVAVVACSSYWSSHWSGYGHLADRNDLDLVLHCGDYIHDFVDEDEEVRARKDRKDIDDVDYRDWLDLAEVRRRYALYRSDPNLLRAHQQHPWMIVWDNHDIDEGFGNELDSTIDLATSTCTLADTTRAFHEWTPTRNSRPARWDAAEPTSWSPTRSACRPTRRSTSSARARSNWR